MKRILLLTIITFSMVRCNSVDYKSACKGEWGYYINDTTYAEILINDTIVYPYHHNSLNAYAYRYKISNDTFYLYGNKNGTVEMSPIKLLGPDSFQILGITPSTLGKIKHKKDAPNTMAKYFYKIGRLVKNKTAVEIIEDASYSIMLEKKKEFDRGFLERREYALYEKNNVKSKDAS